MKISILYPNTSKEFYHRQKISEKDNERWMYSRKKVFLKFSQELFTRKHQCWGLLLNKNAGLRVCNFIQKKLRHRCFLVNIAKFLRTPILKNINELLFERFPTCTSNINYIGSETKFFSKQKQKNHSKSQLDEKYLPFHDVLDHFIFPISPLHARQRLPYILKDDSSEGL